MRLALPPIWLRMKLLLFGLLVMLPLLGYVLFDYLGAVATLPVQQLHRQTTRAQTVGFYLDDAFDDALGYGALLATARGIRSLQPATATTRLPEMPTSLLEARNISVWDAQGRNVASLQPLPDGVAVSVADLPHFQRAMETNQPVISDVYQGRILTGEYLVAVATPIRDDSGRPIGTVHIVMALDDVIQPMGALGEIPGESLILVDHTGRVAYATGDNASAWVGYDLSNYAPVRGALMGAPVQSERVTVPPVEGTYTATWVPTPRYGWVVGSVIPVENALQPAENELRRQLIVVGGAFLLAVVLAIVISDILVRPIYRLVEVCRAVGRGNLNVRADVRTGDEIERLGNAVNIMINDLARRERERAELERAREEFISIVAHDLRAPLTVISGYTQLLERMLSRERWTPSERKAVTSIAISTSRLEAMVNDLLDASRIEAHRLKLEIRDECWVAFIRETLEELRPMLGEHPLLFRSSACDPVVPVDPRRLTQILSNLLTNAAKYSVPRAPIEVYAGYTGGWAELRVTDHGRGIPPDVIPRVFQRFYRSAERTKERTEGLGLGLYITRGLVEAHGGSINVVSTVGVGSTFTVRLPHATGCPPGPPQVGRPEPVVISCE